MPSESSPPVHIVPPCHEEVGILYEDDSLLLVDKPSGLLSVPGRHPANRDCLISRVQENYPDALIVHRLDLDTSGIMVIARGKEIHRHLSRQFQERETHKEYIADVYGLLEQSKGEVELPLICDWPNRPRQKVDHEVGKPALTGYECLSHHPEGPFSRVRLLPVTGRSHQLRVHMAAIGHPILGCEFYAHKAAFEMSKRLRLHAHKLQFTHPLTEQVISGESPVPF